MEYRTTSYISWLGTSDGMGIKRVLEGAFNFVKSAKNEEKILVQLASNPFFALIFGLKNPISDTLSITTFKTT